MKWRIYIILLFGLAEAHAQQLPIFSQYAENIGLINPAGTHTDLQFGDYNLSIGANHRSQWGNIPNGPQTSTLRGEYIRSSGGNFDLLSGLHLNRDRNGRITTTGLYGRIGVIGNLGYNESTGLSLGLLGGVVQYRVESATDIAENPNDPFLLQATQSQIYPDIGLGIHFYHRFNYGWLADDIIRIGVSAPQLLGLDVSFRNEEGGFDLKRIPHYYGTLQYTRMLENDSFLEFSTWVKYVENIPIHIDAIVKLQISDLIWLGVGGSSTKIGHVEMGLILGDNVNLDNKRIRLCYSYDASFSTFFPILGAAHEFSLTYSLSRN